MHTCQCRIYSMCQTTFLSVFRKMVTVLSPFKSHFLDEKVNTILVPNVIVSHTLMFSYTTVCGCYYEVNGTYV